MHGEYNISIGLLHWSSSTRYGYYFSGSATSNTGDDDTDILQSQQNANTNFLNDTILTNSDMSRLLYIHPAYPGWTSDLKSGYVLFSPGNSIITSAKVIRFGIRISYQYLDDSFIWNLLREKYLKIKLTDNPSSYTSGLALSNMLEDVYHYFSLCELDVSSNTIYKYYDFDSSLINSFTGNNIYIWIYRPFSLETRINGNYYPPQVSKLGNASASTFSLDIYY